MTSTPETPAHDGSDLAELRDEIDELKAIPEDELLNPLPKIVEENEATAAPTDAIGSEKWDLPVEDESLDQQ
ncbi:hypothetical protein GCM10009775_31660 [Microbacterium aoyamense]|uniref:Uncharacterized protein n=1 Tax=Microbacterium aoyamense TaxID=344166 RepID=A0ABP5B8U4_9MICO|nr:hypothetical protein [Microbacterium aoyamense]